MRSSEASTWRLNPFAERELAEENGRLVAAGKIRWALVLGLAGVFALPSIGFALNGWFEVLGTTLALLFMIVLGAEALRRSRANTALAMKRRRWMREQHAAVEGWIVEMKVFQGAAVTGRDWGTVWFEDDKLYFVGERTSFGIFASQLQGDLQEQWRLDRLNSVYLLVLAANTAAGRVSIGLNPLQGDVGEGQIDRVVAELAARVQSWKKGEGSGMGQLPPLTLGPDAPSPVSLFAKTAFSLAFWLAALAGLAALGVQSGWWTVTPVAVMGAAIIFPYPSPWALHRHSFALRDRLALEST